MELVTLRSMADRLGLDRSNARKWLLQASAKLGFAPTSFRAPGTGGQNALAWTTEQAAALVEHRQAQGFAVGDDKMPIGREANGYGVFYLLKLAPDLSEKRIKAGFAESMAQRLRDHRCAAPTCEMVKTWPCKKPWEFAAMAAIEAVADRRISAEVFDVQDLDSLTQRLDAFFGLMPDSTTNT